MQNKVYNNEFVSSKENLEKNKEIIEQEKELVLTEQPQEEVSYKRIDIDGGVIKDSSDAEYFQAIQINDVIDNCLLGDFDAKGNYVVSPIIVEELLKMKKVFVSAFEKSVFVESVREFEDYGKINFRLKWALNKQGEKVVVLELLENVNRVNGYFQNTNHVSLLGISINDNTTTEAIYKYFNVVKNADDDGDDGAEKENNKDIIDIINRIAYFQIARVGQRKFMSKYYKDLYEKKIALLSQSKRGAYLLEDFNKEYLYCNNKFFKQSDVEYYKYLNQLIDAIIERNVDFIKDDEKFWNSLKSLQKQSANLFKSTADMVLTATNQHKEVVNAKVGELKGEAVQDISNKDIKQIFNSQVTNTNDKQNTPTGNSSKPSSSKDYDVVVAKALLDKEKLKNFKIDNDNIREKVAEQIVMNYDNSDSSLDLGLDEEENKNEPIIEKLEEVEDEEQDGEALIKNEMEEESFDENDLDLQV